MRTRTVTSAVVLLMGLALLWPAEAAAQRRHAVRVVRAPRVLRVPRVLARAPIYYGPYPSYWGYGFWYPYPYFYGAYDPFWYPYGPWGYRSYGNSAAVRVQAAPREAQVYVDGYFVGRVDDFDGVFQRLRLPPGGHEITLHLTGYRNTAEKIYLQPATTFHLKARLEPLAPGAPQDPPPAPNPAAVKASEYGVDRRAAEPEPERAGPPSRHWPPREQAEARQRPGESRAGIMMIRVQPPDSEILVDGTAWQGGVDEDGAIEIHVPPGRHRVEIRREGYATFVTELEVGAGAATPLNVLLEPERPARDPRSPA